MSRRIVFIAICVVLLLVVSGIATAGYMLGRPFQGGAGGQSRPSPDGRYVAHAFSTEEWSVLGGKRRYSDLWVEAKGKGGTVRRMRVEDTAEPGIDWRIEGEVFLESKRGGDVQSCDGEGESGCDLAGPLRRD